MTLEMAGSIYEWYFYPGIHNSLARRFLILPSKLPLRYLGTTLIYSKDARGPPVQLDDDFIFTVRVISLSPCRRH